MRSKFLDKGLKDRKGLKYTQSILRGGAENANSLKQEYSWYVLETQGGQCGRSKEKGKEEHVGYEV